MDNGNDTTAATDKCLACGRPIRNGEGRFRELDGSFCVECHDSRRIAHTGSLKKIESSESKFPAAVKEEDLYGGTEGEKK